MSIKAVFLDAGHTLLRSDPDLGTIYSDVTAAFGVRLPGKRFTEVVLPTFREVARIYSDQMEASNEQDYAMWGLVTRRLQADVAELRGIEFKPWFDALYGRFGDPEVWKMYDDVVPTLRELRRRGLCTGVVSNWDTRLRRISTGLGLDRLVDFIVISSEVGIRKPDPRIFHAALARAGVRPEEAVHVGDLADEDVAGAQRAGVRAILIDRNYWPGGIGHPPAVPVIRGLGELLPVL